MPITIGSTTTLEWKPTGWDVTGHSATLTVTKPDGSTTTPAVTGPVGGEFTAPLTADQPGRYVLRWKDTTVNAIATDTLEVWPADPRFLISVHDAIAGLKWGPGDIAANSDKLQLYIAAATEVLEDIAGALIRDTVTQTADGGRTGVLLWERPSAILTVTVNGSPTNDYIANLNAGIVYSSPAGSRFADGRQNIVITYRVGDDQISPSVQLAAAELVRHLWQVGQQALNGSPPEPTALDPRQQSFTRSGFAVPNRVIQLIGNHHALPGLA